MFGIDNQFSKDMQKSAWPTEQQYILFTNARQEKKRDEEELHLVNHKLWDMLRQLDCWVANGTELSPFVKICMPN
jgi:hypothetical protein